MDFMLTSFSMLGTISVASQLKFQRKDQCLQRSFIPLWKEHCHLQQLLWLHHDLICTLHIAGLSTKNKGAVPEMQPMFLVNVWWGVLGDIEKVCIACMSSQKCSQYSNWKVDQKPPSSALSPLIQPMWWFAHFFFVFVLHYDLSCAVTRGRVSWSGGLV